MNSSRIFTLVLGLLLTTPGLAQDSCVIKGAPIECYKSDQTNLRVGCFYYKPGKSCKSQSLGSRCMPGDLGPGICGERALKAKQALKFSCSVQFPEKCVYAGCWAKSVPQCEN